MEQLRDYEDTFSAWDAIREYIKAPVAQLDERQLSSLEDAGSTPARGSNT